MKTQKHDLKLNWQPLKIYYSSTIHGCQIMITELEATCLLKPSNIIQNFSCCKREASQLHCQHMVDKLSRCMGQCERIHQTVALDGCFGACQGLWIRHWTCFGIYGTFYTSLTDGWYLPFGSDIYTTHIWFLIRSPVCCLESTRLDAALKIPFKEPWDYQFCVMRSDVMFWVTNCIMKLRLHLKKVKESDSEEVFLDKNWLAASRIKPTVLDLNLFDHQLVDFGNLNAAWLRNGTDLSILRWIS